MTHKRKKRLKKLLAWIFRWIKPFSRQETFQNQEDCPELLLPETDDFFQGEPVTETAVFCKTGEPPEPPEKELISFNSELPELELDKKWMPGETVPDFSGSSAEGNGHDLSSVTEPLQEISRILKENLPGQTV